MHRVAKLLEIVEHQQHLPLAQKRNDLIDRFATADKAYAELTRKPAAKLSSPKPCPRAE